ncbi:MAG: hypothetical protein WC768_01990 [Patescibacteria group bacterium]|jgi:thymidylate kinase
MKKHHLIFEGCELSGKSSLIANIYNFLEKKYNTNPDLLDGCHWFNTDVGIFGGPKSRFFIDQYLEILAGLKDQNVILEKFHLSDIVMQKLLRQKTVNYQKQEKQLLALGAKIIFLHVKPDEQLFRERLKDRLNLYPHYRRIAKSPAWYLKQQAEYFKAITKTKLPCFKLDTTKLPTDDWKKILVWLKEK